MTATPIYQWKGDYYCVGDIIGALMEDQPWSGWVELGNDPDEHSVEHTLTTVAAWFNIDRRDTHQLEAEKFPIMLTTMPDPPAFCRVCLGWFT